IKGDGEIVFVAEVPGPDDKIMVRLVEGVLYIRAAGNFSKEVPVEGSSGMQISDFKYRNGVLTLRIAKAT
ncbi:MAG: Hsp20/alpha crystallin family protein, partial [Thaumarchaeota archaeon]|nr:Hsp20/alpha crystallin family protein [Nitrososphaerota archaeon]